MKRAIFRPLFTAFVAILIPACGGGGNGNGGGGPGGNSPPGSTGWTEDPGNPVLLLSTSSGWDSYGVFFPSVVHPSANSYLMWYEGYHELFVAVDPPSQPVVAQNAIIGGVIIIRGIGLATSSDGFAWTRSGTAPVLSGLSGNWDESGVGTPCLLPNGANDRMWYTGWGATTNAIGLATFDGVSMAWKNSAGPVLSPDPTPAWDSAGVTSPCVVFDGSTYKMWYVSASSESYAGLGIGRADSADGVTWTKSPSNPVLLPGASGEADQDGVGSAWVVQDGSTYRMWYAGWKGGTPTLCYADSADGVQWRKYSGNPVLGAGPAGSWNSHGLSTPSVLLGGGQFRMWMAGLDDFNEPQIGTASNP